MPEKKRGRPAGRSAKRTRPRKTESLTIRLDTRTRFMLDFVAKYRDESITRIIERAVEEFAKNRDNVVFGDDPRLGLSWRDYWHPSADVRAVKSLVLGLPRKTAEEEELEAFLTVHSVFFYQAVEVLEHRDDPDSQLSLSYVFNVERIEALWPDIDELVEKWKATRSTDRDAVGHKMKADLELLGIDAPEWPPISTPRPPRYDTVQIF